MLKKFGRNLRLGIASLFYGMKGANDTIINPATTSSSEEVNQKQELKGNVFSEMLQEQETQQVQETRDAYYRAYREADKYSVQISGIGEDGEIAGDLSAVAVKKTVFEKPRIPVYETKGYRPRIVQNAKDYENDEETKFEEAIKGEAIDNKDTFIYSIKYKDGILPRFYVEKYITKLVVKENSKGKIKLDLYFSMYARQFVKRDSLFIAELNGIYNNTKTISVISDIEELSFVSDKAFGIENLHKITFSNIKYKKAVIFDGCFVLEFDANMTDEDITAKYHMDSLDEKYKNKAPKKQTTDINAITRRIEKEEEEKNNFETTTLKLK